jgi:hypothetical protein
MTNTEKHQEFVVRLTDLVKEFHEENPDLFIGDIDIHNGKLASGRLVLLGVSVHIQVQPDRGPR